MYKSIIPTLKVKEKTNDFLEELKDNLCGDLSEKDNVEGHINEGIIDKLTLKHFGDKLINEKKKLL